MIFLDTNLMSETLRKAADSAVLAWLVRHDAESALPTVAVAERRRPSGEVLTSTRA
ncbi:hypothetical protein D3C71_2039070 [compost metagenome]